MCADNKHITVQLKGTFRCAHGGTIIEIKGALYYPGAVTLISVDQLTAMGLKVLFDTEGVSFYRSMNALRKDQPVLRSHRRIGEKLYTIRTRQLRDYNSDKSKFQAFLTKFAEECDANVLHRRYDHAPLKILKMRFPHLQNTESLDPCYTCIANQRRKSYKSQFTSDKGKPIVIENLEMKEDSVEAEIERVLANFDTDDGKRRYGRYLMSDTKVLLNYPSVRGYTEVVKNNL